ncbi:hypothetical protein [Salmonella enterica]|uniref:hypothetical protein n=1 Tax=Salmonella enterica TaxID=28901 RepID=UPI003D31AF42
MSNSALQKSEDSWYDIVRRSDGCVVFSFPSSGRHLIYRVNGMVSNGSVIQQVLPTYYVNRLQQQFSPYFSSLQITLVSDDPPVYNISAITNAGSKIIATVNV